MVSLTAFSTINHRYFRWLRFAGTTNQRYHDYCPIYTATRSVSHQGAYPSRKTRSTSYYRNYATECAIRCGSASGVDQSKSDSPKISASGPHIGFGRHQRSTADVRPQVFVFRIVHVLPSWLSVTASITRLVQRSCCRFFLYKSVFFSVFTIFMAFYSTKLDVLHEKMWEQPRLWFRIK